MIVTRGSATLPVSHVESAVFIAILVVGIFVVDFIVRWWRENEWCRKWKQRDDD